MIEVNRILEVTKFELAFIIQEILRFNVAMANILLLKSLQKE